MMLKPSDTEVARLLSFLFLAYSTVTDGDLAPEELEMIATKLKPWIPPSAPTQLVEFVEQAAALYDAHDSEDAVWASASDFARLLRGRINDEQAAQIIDDLAVIAAADGLIHPGEVRFVRRTMDIFGVPGENPIVAGPVKSSVERE